MGTNVYGQTALCGSFTHTHTGQPSNDSLMRFYDDFGNEYYWSELQKTPQMNTASCTAGLFNISFEDVATNNGIGNGIGFDDNISGQARREVVCQVFTDLSDLLNYPTPANPLDLVQIKIGISNNINSQILAAASPIHAIPQGVTNGIVDNEVYKTIVTGQNSYNNIPMGIPINTGGGFHGILYYNFPSNIHYLPCFSINQGEYDFYTITLHEALHLLGFSSGIDANGFSSIYLNNNNIQVYNRFGAMIEYNGQPLINTSNPNSIPPLSVAQITAGCNSHFFTGGGLNEEIFCPTSWVNGASMSHYNCVDPNNPCPAPVNDYVMRPYLCPDEIKRHPNDEEYQTLCALGYNLTNSYGDVANPTNNIWACNMLDVNHTYSVPCVQSSCFVEGVNDMGLFVAMNPPGATNNITVLPLINDVSVGLALNLNMSNLQIITGGTSSNISAITSNSFVYTPPSNFSGWAVFSYYPACNGMLSITQAYIWVWVLPSIALLCPPSQICDNIVCMGDFEMFSPQFPPPSMSYGIQPISNFSVDPVFTNTPDLFSVLPNGSINVASGSSCGTLGNITPDPSGGLQFGGMGVGMEGLAFPLNIPMLGGTPFDLSFLALPKTLGLCEPIAQFYLSENPPCSPSPGVYWTTGCPAFNPIPVATQVISTQNVPVNFPNWMPFNQQNLIAPGSVSTQYKYLILTLAASNPATASKTYALFDNIAINPHFAHLTATITPATQSICPNQDFTYSISITNPCAPTNTFLQLNMPPMNPAFTLNPNNNPDFFVNAAANNMIQTPNFFIATGQTLNFTLTLNSGIVPAGSYSLPIVAAGACIDGGLNANVEVTEGLTIQKSILSPQGTNPQPGDVVTYQITITNPCADITGVIINDQLPTGLLANTLQSNDLIHIGNNLLQNPTPLTIPNGVTVLTYDVMIDPLLSPCITELQNCATITAANGVANLPITYCHTITFPQPTIDITIQGPITSSQLFGNPAFTLSNQNIFIAGEFIIDCDNFVFDECDITFAPGARITVFGSLEIRRSHLHTSCNSLWHGIELRNDAYCENGRLSMTESVIEDAYIAVNYQYLGLIHPMTGAQIQDTRFNKNYISINIPDVGQNKVHPIAIQGDVSFDCDQPLLPNYDASLPQTDTRSFSAINIENYFLNLNPVNANNLTARITLQNQAFGIRAFYSDVRVQNCQFKDIQPVASYGTLTQVGNTPLDGCAIFSSGFDINWHIPTGIGYLNVQGQLPNGDNMFENCYMGIHALYNQKVRVNQAQMIGMRTGIGLWFMDAGKHADIDNNKIEAYLNGVHTLGCSGVSSINILNNQDIRMVASNQNVHPIGIAVYNWLNMPDAVVVSGNHVEMDVSGVGILSSGTAKNLIIDNIVNLNSDIPHAAGITGIQVNASNSNTLNCNTVTGAGFNQVVGFIPKGAAQIAYRLNSAQNNLLRCNTSDATRYGFYYSGNSTADYRFKGNEMQNHYIGLNVPKDGVMGVQIADATNPMYNGNRWTGTAGAYHAANWNVNPLNVQFSQFYVRPNVANTLPTNIFVASGGTWFFPNFTYPITFSCTNPCMGSSASNIVGGSDDFSETERAVAEGDSLTDEFVEQNLWQGERTLFAKLDTTTWENDSLMVAFYLSKQSTNLANFYHSDKATKTLIALDSLRKINITNIGVQIENVQGQIYIGDSLRLVNANDSLVWMDQKDSLVTILRLMQNALVNEYRQEQITDSLHSEAIGADNATITTTRIFEENERQVKDIYLRTFGRGNLHLNSTDVAALYSIAIQCPLSGGDAVYWARSMYKLVDDNLYYNDIDVCETEGLQYRYTNPNPITSKSNLDIKVYPNPAKDKLHIQNNQNLNAQFTLYDVLGKKVVELAVSAKTETDISLLPSSLYFYRMILEDNSVIDGKLIIQH